MKKLLGPLLVMMLTLFAVPASALPTTAAAAPYRAPTDAVPWDQVGPGWTLATVARGPRTRDGYVRARVRTLELLSPDGVRHELFRSRVELRRRGWLAGDFYLSDVDPARRAVLLLDSTGPHTQRASELDLVTGERRTLTLPANTGGVGLRPDGTGVLVQTVQGNVLSLGWSGGRHLVDRGVVGALLATPDGAALVGNDPDELRVIPLDGSPVRTVETPGDCRPLRWYDDAVLLASCYSRRGTRLTAVGLDGTTTPVAGLRRTNSRHFRGPSWDDTEVRVAGDRTIYQGNGSCGGSFLTRERADGTVRMVRVPGSTGGVTLLDAVDDRLRIAHTGTCDGGQPRAVLSLFDPVSEDEDVLLTLGRRQAWSQVRTWDELRPWGF